MALFFITATALVLVWFFIESRTTRLVAFAIIAFFAMVSAVFFFVLDDGERRKRETPEARPALKEIERQRQLAGALTVSSAALIKPRLEPRTVTAYDSAGVSYQRKDLFSWRFSGDVVNVAQQHALNDITFLLLLFSCPSFVIAPSEQLTLTDLAPCTRIGERSVALYDLNIQPGQSKTFEEANIIFENQREPENWRYNVEIIRVSAVPL